MGDFNLKTAADYKIPEHMRINAAKKEEELGYLDSMVLTRSFYDNETFLFLKKNSAKTTHFVIWSIKIYNLGKGLHHFPRVMPIFTHEEIESLKIRDLSMIINITEPVFKLVFWFNTSFMGESNIFYGLWTSEIQTHPYWILFLAAVDYQKLRKRGYCG